MFLHMRDTWRSRVDIWVGETVVFNEGPEYSRSVLQFYLGCCWRNPRVRGLKTAYAQVLPRWLTGRCDIYILNWVGEQLKCISSCASSWIWARHFGNWRHDTISMRQCHFVEWLCKWRKDVPLPDSHEWLLLCMYMRLDLQVYRFPPCRETFVFDNIEPVLQLYVNETQLSYFQTNPSGTLRGYVSDALTMAAVLQFLFLLRF